MAGIHPHHFKLLGGHAALDFVNTVRDWTATPLLDYLNDFDDAVRFGHAAGLLGRGETPRLRDRSRERELKRLRELRLLLKRIFQSCLAGEPPREEDLQILGASLAEVARSMQFVAAAPPRGSRLIPVRRNIIAKTAGDALLRFRVIESATTLLVSDSMLRLKSCPTCGWFFVDVSKNGSRRWCSMQACGSVAKARRYYRRQKAARGRSTQRPDR